MWFSCLFLKVFIVLVVYARMLLVCVPVLMLAVLDVVVLVASYCCGAGACFCSKC